MTGNGMYFFDLFWENNGVFAIRTIGFFLVGPAGMRPASRAQNSKRAGDDLTCAESPE